MVEDSGRAVDKDVQYGLTPLSGIKRRDPFQIEYSRGNPVLPFSVVGLMLTVYNDDLFKVECFAAACCGLCGDGGCSQKSTSSQPICNHQILKKATLKDKKK
jgi:hypothetical protein